MVYFGALVSTVGQISATLARWRRSTAEAQAQNSQTYRKNHIPGIIIPVVVGPVSDSQTYRQTYREETLGVLKVVRARVPILWLLRWSEIPPGCAYTAHL